MFTSPKPQVLSQVSWIYQNFHFCFYIWTVLQSAGKGISLNRPNFSRFSFILTLEWPSSELRNPHLFGCADRRLIGEHFTYPDGFIRLHLCMVFVYLDLRWGHHSCPPSSLCCGSAVVFEWKLWVVLNGVGSGWHHHLSIMACVCLCFSHAHACISHTTMQCLKSGMLIQGVIENVLKVK